jgi:adrenodoxin-NADP+ reductase
MSTDQIKATKPGSQKIVDLLRARQIRYVDKFGWKKIDDEEISRGKLVGKPRDKITKIEEMLEVAFSK